MDPKAHWEAIHQENYAKDVSWYQDTPTVSLRLLRSVASPESRVLDVGCGQSGIAGHLVAAGFRDVTACDISPEAIRRARDALGATADRVTWLETDVRDLGSERPFDVWHDRAVLHFFLDDEDRRRYVDSLTRNVAPGGHAIIATFAPDGPERCSGLPVRRHSADDLAALLGPAFTPVASEHELHRTPWGKIQAFQWGMFRSKVR